MLEELGERFCFTEIGLKFKHESSFFFLVLQVLCERWTGLKALASPIFFTANHTKKYVYIPSEHTHTHTQSHIYKLKNKTKTTCTYPYHMCWFWYCLLFYLKTKTKSLQTDFMTACLTGCNPHCARWPEARGEQGTRGARQARELTRLRATG